MPKGKGRPAPAPEPYTQSPLWVPSLTLAAAPRFPEKAPHSLFLQEVHLQALQVQEPAQLQEPPARKGKASSEQGEGCRRYSRRSAMPPCNLFLGAGPSARNSRPA